MDEALLRNIATSYLVPFFSGAKLLTKAMRSSRHDSRVAFTGPQSIAFKISSRDRYRLVLTREQPFATKSSASIIPEIEVVRSFVSVLRSLDDSLENAALRTDLLSTFQRRIVAKAINSGDVDGQEEVLLAGIDQLSRWAARLYEGAPISAAIGFRHKPQTSSAPTLEGLDSHDFSSVLSNGHDTILEFDFAGRLVGHESIRIENGLASFCPYRHASIADWTADDEHKRRVAMILNRVGEILICRDKQLLFARRSGKWHFLTHGPLITQMGTPHDSKIRTAVYETCLDASFARTGACIGIVSSSQIGNWKQVVVSEDDYLAKPTSMKSAAIARIVGSKKFHALDRRLRQELVAIDGATVISHKGDILSVGAILKIPGGSTGGGRRAAAQALARLGLGIKVSQDGSITGFRLSPEPAFALM